MLHGDLDNRLPPRWLVTFEGVIARHAMPRDRLRYDSYCRIHAWKRAMDTFEPDKHSIKVLWDLTWRQEYKFDVVTFLPERIADRCKEWIDRYNIPAANLFRFDAPAGLAQDLAFMPDVYAVVHAEPSNRFTYGDRGMLVDEGWRI